MYNNNKCSVKNRTINNPVLLDFIFNTFSAKLQWTSAVCRTGNGGKLSNSWLDCLTWLCFGCSLLSLHFLCDILQTFTVGNGRFGGVNETMHACPLVILSYQQSTPIAEYIHWLHTDDYRHCARSASLNSPQSLAHVRGAADELLAKSMYVVVAHGAGLDVLASVI